MAGPARFPLAVTLPPEVLERPVTARFGFPFRLLLVLGLLPLLLGASALAMYRQQQADRIYTGVRVFGLDLSRMERTEAAGALRRHLSELGRRRFELRFDEEAIGVSLATMGFTIDENDVDGLVDHAWSVGRDDDLRSWLRDQLVLFRHGYDVPATGKFDRERASAVLGRIAPDVERVTLNADLSVQRAGDRFEIHTAPAQMGRRLDVNATLERLQKAMVGTVPDHVELVLNEAPPAITDADVLPARQTIEVLLGSPLELRDGQRAWRLEPAAAYDMLEIVGLREKALPITARLNEEKLAQFVERTARAANDPAINPFFAIENGEIVVRPGRDGRIADAAKTLEALREKLYQPEQRTVEIAFTEDKPWLRPEDLETDRLLANTMLDLPITIETPAGVPGIVEKTWTLGRADLLQLLVLPSTRNAPRDYTSLPAAQRPRYLPALDSGRVANLLGREIAPWVSEDPIDAALEMRTTRVEVPNPAFGTSDGATFDVPPTLFENRYTVGLRNARDGRGPDYDGTFAQIQAQFRQGSTLLTPPVVATPAPPPVRATPAPTAIPGATPQPTPMPTPLPVVTPVSLATEEIKALAEQRRVTVRLAPRRPRVVDLDLALARDQANGLIGEPVVLRWRTGTWTVTRDELVNMLRYQPGRDGKLTAYLTRDGLLAKATQIAREVERSALAPRTATGDVLPLDVPATAGVIWQLASTTPRDRVGELVWAEEDPVGAAPAASLPETP